MTFRSDDDAREERLRTLEKQLEDARRELSVARPKVVRLEIAEKENKRLLAELARGASARAAPRTSLGSGSGGTRGPLAALAVMVAVLFVGLGVAAFLVTNGSDPASAHAGDTFAEARARADAQDRATAAAEEARRAAEAREGRAAVARMEAEAEALRAQVAVPVPAPEPAPEVDPASVVDRSVDFAPIIRSARVVSVSGEAPVARRARCHVTLTAGQGDCRASVECGDESLYPRTGSGGFFRCLVEDHVLRTGADLNPTPSSGDPRLDLDATTREIRISDDPPAWSVRLVYDAP